jgi:hypothetical protein
MTITLADREFDGPVLLKDWNSRPVPGVYTLLVLDGEEYRPVFVGETPNFQERAFPPSRKGLAGWLVLADYHQSIYIAVHPLPGASERKAIERQLLQTYQPECNAAFPARSLVAH